MKITIVAMTPFTIISNICSSLNVITWIGVAIGQMFANYKNESSDAISFLLVYCWLFGGSISLFSAILANAANTIIYIGIPHLILDISMLSQLIYYRIKNRVWFANDDLIFIIISLIFVIVFTTFTNDEIIISVFSWSATLIFIIAKVPQILLNRRRHSCQGLSIVSFICVIFTNLLFLTSVFVLLGNYPDRSDEKSIDKLQFIKNNLAWIFSSSISFLLDIVILSQFWIYRNNSPFGEEYSYLEIE